MCKYYVRLLFVGALGLGAGVVFMNSWLMARGTGLVPHVTLAIWSYLLLGYVGCLKIFAGLDLHHLL